LPVHPHRPILKDMKHIATALVILLSLPAWAGSDHDRARQAVQSGRIVPLTKILDRVAADFPGEVIEAELEDDHSRPIYEIKLITPQGRVLKLIYDAGDGSLLRTKEKGPR
jgi:uncharacterized membrane protein YkoI